MNIHLWTRPSRTRHLRTRHLRTKTEMSANINHNINIYIILQAMPKSNSIPLLGVYILVVILLCAISVAISMAFMASSKRYVEGARIPSQLTYKLSLVRPRIKRTKDLKRINMEEEGEGLLLNRGKSLREQLFIGGIRFTETYMEEEGGEGGECEENKNNYGSFGETKERSNNKNGVLGNNNRRLSPKLEDNFNGDNKKRRATTTNIE